MNFKKSEASLPLASEKRIKLALLLDQNFFRNCVWTNVIFVPKTFGSTNNCSINNQINNLNYALFKIINSFIHLTIPIASRYFNLSLAISVKMVYISLSMVNICFSRYLTRMFEFFTR